VHTGDNGGNAMSGDATYDDDALEAGRLLFARPCIFLRGVVDMRGLPDAVLPEVCFAGRSNVGKSSLINAVTGQKSLARTSDTPGRTQEINYFDADGRVLIADLPGYGFARAPKAKVEQWTALVMRYLRGRPNLRRVLLLIDSRHGIKANDREVMTMLDDAAVNYQIILTKVDKLKAGGLDAVKARTVAELSKHVAAHPVILATSSAKSQGIAEVRAEIAALAST